MRRISLRSAKEANPLLFLKKKTQKDFYLFGRVAGPWGFHLDHETNETQVFGFFFTKKKNRPA
jgi:hypothetical protein